jgi:subtilisin family serine protease
MHHLCGTAWLFCVALVHAQDVQKHEKIDDGLNGALPVPVFVRMADQLLAGSGDHEAFCHRNAQRRRSELRVEVVKTLRAKAEKSWAAVADLVGQLTMDGGVSEVHRYWIINGFACSASRQACERLAAHDAVGFVYRQTLPSHYTGVVRASAQRPSRSRPRGRRDLQAALDMQEKEGPFSMEGVEVPWNLERIRADKAWVEEGVTGEGVVVALMDSGLQVTPALAKALWRNADEVLDGKDSDGNGFVDDLFGYDFASDSGECLGDGDPSHGSFCGGIIAGRPTAEQPMVTGVAPRARLMVIRGTGRLRAYEYALANGADILSMSFTWSGRQLGNYRGVYRLIHEHLDAAGVLSVGGAGNYALSIPPGRQIALPKDIPCVIAAAGILKSGERAPPSSRGPCQWAGVVYYDDYPPEAPLEKPDVTGVFGGYPVWGKDSSRRRWRKLFETASKDGALIVGPQGNSFSGPHAAGVAALMWSANRELLPSQVKALMEETCLDIGESGRDLDFGAGLLQADAAVRAAKANSK